MRFIGHFIRVYERSAPPFTRESLRWSADPANVARYLDAGAMTDVRALHWGHRGASARALDMKAGPGRYARCYPLLPRKIFAITESLHVHPQISVYIVQEKKIKT